MQTTTFGSVSQAIPDRTSDCPALQAVRRRAMGLCYGDREINRIVNHVAVEGTLAGIPGVGPIAEALLEEAFINALPVVPYGDSAWGTLDDIDDIDFLLPLAGGAPDAGEWDDTAEVQVVTLDDGPDPSDDDAQDHSEYLAWLDSLAAVPDDQVEPDVRAEMLDWYAQHPLGEFNAVRHD